MSPVAAILLTVAVIGQEPAPPPKPVQPKTPPKSEKKEPGLPSGLVKARLLGPAVTSGRVVGFAVHPNDRATFYVAIASGGVWKTTNAGTTWTPVFDNEGSYSIGYVALDPKNPNTVWVGTGENNSQRSVGYGDGVYKSTNGGQSWTNVGLKQSEHIGRILIHPTDSNTVYVAAQGPLWGPGGDRGLYKTTDGGQKWSQVLAIDENTGVTDVAMPDPQKPDILLAASWQRRRHVWTLINGGPGSGLHRSTDGGKTWKKVTAGLPSGDLGRIGLATCPSDPMTVYALVETADGTGGIIRSTNRGESWQKRNPFEGLPMYYGNLFADPVNKDRLYVMDTIVRVSDDGGATIRALGAANTHVDYHAIWVDPKDPKYYLLGCDGGAYDSHDAGVTWEFKANLPVTQFYDVEADQNPKSGKFYHVYGGTQDNATYGAPVRTRSSSGITNADWYCLVFGDGFHVKVDPTDPDTVYAEYQYGVLCRFDRKTGTRVFIQPMPAPGEPPLRWNWDSPLMISPHNPKRIYFASNRLYRSNDRGDSWTAVSPDLTRQLDRDKLPVMGKVWGPDAVARHQSTSFYGNIVALAESHTIENLILAGTDDGLIQVTTDGGKTWTKLDKFTGVPEGSYVSKLVASRHAGDTFYASFDNHKMSDFKPYLLKTTDAGKTWVSIVGDLPDRGTVYCVAEDHTNPNFLFCGTEFGLYVTHDGGKKWQRVKDGLPTIQVKDLVIQRHNNDLVIGTFGRGIYVIDDYTPLRAYKPELEAKPAHVHPPADALLFALSSPYGVSGKAFQGASFYTADNPTYGATFVLHLKEAVKSQKELRTEKKDAPPPTQEQLRAEAEEEAPSVSLTITDADGNVLRTVGCPTTAGWHRVTWDLREAGFRRAVPGTYKAALSKRVGGKSSPLDEAVEFKVVPDPLLSVTPAQFAELAAFNKETRTLQRALVATTGVASELVTRLEQIKSALEQADKQDEPSREKVRALIAQVKLVQRAISGDSFLASRNENAPMSISERIGDGASANSGAVAPPTAAQKQALADGRKQLAAEVAKLRAVQEKEIPELEKKLEALGAPLPPGKLPKLDGK